MVGIEIDQQKLKNQQEALAALFVNEPETRKRIRKIVREELKDAVKRAQEDARFELPNDPRKAYRAVKFSVYKKIMGGNISILARRKAGTRYMLVTPRSNAWRWGRGGNRRTRSPRTNQMDTYFGKDRGFILRFFNSGTGERNIKFTPNDRRKVDKHNRHPNTGSRGAIARKDWFENMGQKEMELAAENLAMVIEEELADIYREINKM